MGLAQNFFTGFLPTWLPPNYQTESGGSDKPSEIFPLR